MSQRNSGYARIEDDRYETPAWVTKALLAAFEVANLVYEPSAGHGKIVRALRESGRAVWSNDLRPLAGLCSVHDFLDVLVLPVGDHAPVAIVGNPPFGEDRGQTATRFIEHALDLTAPCLGQVCFLLKTDFDHAGTRRHLFRDHGAFAGTVVLTNRIRWIEGSTGSPSENFSWFIWDWQHGGIPTIRYGENHGAEN